MIFPPTVGRRSLVYDATFHLSVTPTTQQYLVKEKLMITFCNLHNIPFPQNYLHADAQPHKIKRRLKKNLQPLEMPKSGACQIRNDGA
jgi:hypothetical protein